MPLRYAVVRYRTDPDRISRLLPPKLEPASVAEVVVDFLVIDLGEHKSVFVPRPYCESALWVRSSYQGEEGFLLLSMPLNGDWGRFAGRELLALTKKDGEVGIEKKDGKVEAWIRRRGLELCRLEAEVTDGPAPEVNWLRETRFGGFALNFRLDPDWRGPPFVGGVDLLREAGTATPPSEEPREGQGVPRALNLTNATFRFVQPSVLDPWCELLVIELLGGSYYENPGLELNFGSSRPRRKGPNPEVLHRYEDPLALAPWMFLGHDRPVERGLPWKPRGWPDAESAFVLSQDEISAWQGRQAFSLQGVRLFDLVIQIDSRLHADVLPDGVEPGPESLGRILALDVPTSDLSTVGFAELWLLVRCVVGGRAAWYALSHIVKDGGDLLLGREMFGYPSKAGEVNLELAGERVTISGERAGRRFLSVAADGFEAAQIPSVEEIDVLGLQADTFSRSVDQAFDRPFSQTLPVKGRLVAQKWHLDLRRISVDPGAVSLDLPDAPGPPGVGRPDPWYEFEGCTVLSASLATGAIRRGPGNVVGEYEDVWPYYRERCDGTWAATKVLNEVQPTFRIKREKDPE